MSFANPNVLWLLLVFPPALLLFFWWSWRKRQELMTRFIQARLLSGLVTGLSPVRQRIRLGCLLGAVACLIVALARPQWGFTWQEVKQRGVDIVVAIDVSKSMLAEDIAPNRLARAKLAALDLMHLARSDRLGLVAFAGSAFLQCPLTIDDSAFRQGVESLDVKTIPQGGTALAEAIQAALTAFKEGDNHKVLVLMTDGEDQDSGALEAAQKAAESGLKIFTIGIGTAEGQLLKIKDAQGKEDYVRDEQGNVVKSHLNERLLQEIAGASQGGFYLPLRGAKTMDALYTQGLAPLPKSENQAKLVRQYQDRYHWPLALAIVLLIVETLLPERKRESRPGVRPLRPPKAALQTAVALLLLLPVIASASNSSALREYKAGKYEEALKEYQRLLERKTDDPRLHFNAGAAAYRSQQFGEAAKQFNQAMAAQDLKLQELAYYNHGNSLYWMGEKNEDPTKRKEAWEQAVKDYDLSLKLNGADPDAKFNKEFVTKKLEELKQQQQQNQKNDKNKQDQNKQDQNQQQQSQQDQQKKDDSKQDQGSQQQQQQQQDQQQQKQDSSQQNQASQQQQKQEDQKQQQAASQPQGQKQQKQEKQQQKDQQQANASKGQQGQKDAKDQQAEASYAAGQMTPEQAEHLLDAQKSDEMMLPVKPEGKPADRSKPLRDW